MLSTYETRLKLLAARFPASFLHLIERGRTQLIVASSRLTVAHLIIMKLQSSLTGIKLQLQNLSGLFIKDKKGELELTGQFLKLISPDYILARGYSLTLKNGKIVKRAAGLAAGDAITIRYVDGEREATVK
jgi:exodeoxyribonuclease VII large subunit